MKNPSDRSTASSNLLRMVRASDAVAWQRFVELYASWVYALVRRAGFQGPDAADVGQEVFLTAAMRIESFRRDEPGQSVRHWLRRIIRNKIGDALRSSKHQPALMSDRIDQFANPVSLATLTGGSRIAELQTTPVSEGQSCQPLESSSDGEDPLTDRQLLLRRLLNITRGDFEENTWMCFEAIVMQGRSSVDVADELGMSSRAVRQAKYRVLRRLRREYVDLIGDIES